MVFAVILTLAIGTSWLLRKIVPGLETGAGITIGVVATVFSLNTPKTKFFEGTGHHHVVTISIVAVLAAAHNE